MEIQWNAHWLNSFCNFFYCPLNIKWAKELNFDLIFGFSGSGSDEANVQNPRCNQKQNRDKRVLSRFKNSNLEITGDTTGKRKILPDYVTDDCKI